MGLLPHTSQGCRGRRPSVACVGDGTGWPGPPCRHHLEGIAAVRLSRAATRLLAGLIALDLAAVSVTLGVMQTDPLPAAAADLRHAKVAIIVGPVGSLTDS